MIGWYLLFTTASCAFLVSGTSLHTGAREEGESRQWQQDMERLRSQMEQWFQNAFSENQRRQMMRTLEAAFNPNSMMDRLRDQFQFGGGQSDSSDTAQRSGRSEGASLDYPGRRSWVQLSADENTAATLPPGKTPMNELPSGVHSAPQFAQDQSTPDPEVHPGPSPPSRSNPARFPNGQDVPPWPRRGRGSPRWSYSRQRPFSQDSSEETRESTEEFFPGQGQGRPDDFPGQRFPGQNRGRSNWNFSGRTPPTRDSSGETQLGGSREDLQGDEQRGQFPNGFGQPSQFTRPAGPPTFFSPGQQNEASSEAASPGLGESRPDERPRASQTQFDMISGNGRFQGRNPPAQGPTGEFSSSQGSSGQYGTWLSSFSRSQAMSGRSVVRHSQRQVSPSGNPRGQGAPAMEPSGQSPPGQSPFGNSPRRQGSLYQPSSRQNTMNRISAGLEGTIRSRKYQKA